VAFFIGPHSCNLVFKLVMNHFCVFHHGFSITLKNLGMVQALMDFRF
jgi:hypothetical protein